MKYRILRAFIVYENGIKDTMECDYETNYLENERKLLTEQFSCKYVYFTFGENIGVVKAERKLSFDEIVCKAFNMPISCMKSNSRKRVDVEVRQFAMWYRHDRLKESTNQVGKLYERDHATVLYAKRTVRDLMKTDKEFSEKAEKAIAALEMLKN